MPNAPQASSDHAAVSRSRSSQRDAVAASVTNAPHSRWSSQVSDVVATPSVVTCSRSQVILGAAKYGSSSSPVMRGQPRVPAVAREPLAHDGRRAGPASRARPPAGCRWRGPTASTVSPWFASATASTVGALRGREQRQRAGVDDRAPELLGILLDAAAVERDRVHGHLAHAEHLAVVVDDEGLGRRRPLVDGEDGHRAHRQPIGAHQARIRSPAGS